VAAWIPPCFIFADIRASEAGDYFAGRCRCAVRVAPRLPVISSNRINMALSENLQTRLIAAVAEAGKAGMLTADIARQVDRSSNTVATNLAHAEARGLLSWWPDPLGRCQNRRRWWLAELRPERCPKPSGLRPISEQTAGMAWRSNQAVEASERPERRDWTHDRRYQLPPGARVDGGFSTMGIGRYLEQTG
jgi:hypothetical protein